MSEHFDAVVIGAGPAGEVASSRLPERGLRTALIERELVGGECGYWACIPSKTLLRPTEAQAEAVRTPGLSEPTANWTEIVEYRDSMIRNLDDSGAVKGYQESGVSVFKGEARIVAPGTIEVEGTRLTTEARGECMLVEVEALTADLTEEVALGIGARSLPALPGLDDHVVGEPEVALIEVLRDPLAAVLGSFRRIERVVLSVPAQEHDHGSVIAATEGFGLDGILQRHAVVV